MNIFKVKKKKTKRIIKICISKASSHVTTFIKRRAHITLVSKEDIGSDSPSLIRDKIREIRSPE